jgi:deoxyribodipyrimidine photo-lyase
MNRPVIMWFRQDLRLADNAALSAAAVSGPLVPLYILDDETAGHWRLGGASRWWLHHSLTNLGRSLPLVLRRGRADLVLADVITETGAAAVHFGRGHAHWSGPLEARVKAICERAGLACHRYGGALLHEPETIRNGAGEAYRVYTPFARACYRAGEPGPPRPAPALPRWKGTVASDNLADWQLAPFGKNWASRFEEFWQPGEVGARARLAQFLAEGLAAYAGGRDRPDLEATSRLSPHLHFGELSPSQCWRAVRAAAAERSGANDQAAEKFLGELLWREFSAHLLHQFPDLPERPFRPEFAAFPWREDRKALKAWQRGRTGYPIVDAGMRELWATGTMHNRVRMIAASFLVKDLLIHWRHGEDWFWDTLVDADIASNAANWQWVAGCGADAAPYFRIFNPVLQGRKFDPKGNYVRRWLPELAALPDRSIHNPWTAPDEELRRAGIELGRTYPHPVVDHAAARDRALAALKELKGAGQ